MNVLVLLLFLLRFEAVDEIACCVVLLFDVSASYFVLLFPV